MIAAMGPVMLRHTRRHADIWNSISFAKTFEEQVEAAAFAALDARCAEIGRDPATLRRSYHVRRGGPPERRQGQLLRLLGGSFCAHGFEQVIALGITEIALYYPIAEIQKRVFERIGARNVLPAMKAAHK